MRPLLGLAGLLIAAGTAAAQTMTPDSGVPLDVATRRAASISGPALRDGALDSAGPRLSIDGPGDDPV